LILLPSATGLKTTAAIEHARNQDVLVSYDPNLRILLWNSLDEAKEVMRLGLQYASVVKLSQEELAFITGIQEEVSITIVKEPG
jgi:fructokinase